MKRNILFLFLFLFLIYMVSCDKGEEKKVFSKLDHYIQSEIDTNVYDTGRIDLPDYYLEYDCEINWKSLNTDYVLDNGVLIKKPDKLKEVVLIYTYLLDGDLVENEIVLTLYPSSISEVAILFENQFSLPIEKSYTDIKTEFFDCYYITWYSSNIEVFSDEGIFNENKKGMSFNIIYTVSFLNEEKEDFVLNCFTDSISDNERIIKTYNEITEYGGFLHETLIDNDIVFFNSYSKYGVYIDFESYDEEVIDENGLIKRSVYRQYVNTKLILSYKSIKREYDLNLIIKEIEVDGLNDNLIIDLFLDSISKEKYGGLEFGYYESIKTPNGNDWIINKSFDFINFYNNEYPKQIESLMKTNNHNLPGDKLKSLEFIVIHDTGSTGSAKNHKDALLNKNSKVSFHYAVDNKEIYHIVSDDLYAYHAGCGKREFKLIDTNIKATNAYPKIEISKEGFYTFNGIVSTVKAPKNKNKILKTKDIVDSGIYTEIGENGNYFINDSYYNSTYKKISNTGGGINGIGIEMCLVPNEDYILTVKNTAKLVAKLLMENKLDIDRVLQHNNFSGKDCPKAIRTIDWFNEFKELILIELFALEYLNEFDFVWNSKSNFLNDNGLITKNVRNNEILKYNCEVYKNGKLIYSKEFTSIIEI